MVKKVSQFKNDLLCILSMEFHSILPSKSLVIVFSIITLSKYQLNSGLGLAFVTTHRTSDLSATASRRTSAGSRASVTSKTLSTLGQFHQHFTSSLYAHISQKLQKDSQVKQLFALLGSVSVKAARKHFKDFVNLVVRGGHAIPLAHVSLRNGLDSEDTKFAGNEFSSRISPSTSSCIFRVAIQSQRLSDDCPNLFNLTKQF